jgi:hypothetical protein
MLLLIEGSRRLHASKGTATVLVGIEEGSDPMCHGENLWSTQPATVHVAGSEMDRESKWQRRREFPSISSLLVE